MTDVFVGYPVRSRLPDGDAIAEDGNGDLVRLVRIAQVDAGAEAALEAWLPAGGDHVQRLLDLGRAPNGDLVAVVAEVPIALVELLAVAPLDAGEAVTVLIPVAEALADLHAAGVAHGAVGAAAIGLTSAGAPVLLMPRTATEAGSGEARAADRRALVDLARRLLPPPLPDPVSSALERDPGAAGVDALFRLADPRPVLLHRAPAGREPAGTTPARLVEPATPTGEQQTARMSHLLPSPASIAARLRRTAAAVRPRVWVAAGLSLASLAAALLLLPGHGAAVRADPVSAPSVPVPSTPSPLPSPRTAMTEPPAPIAGTTEPLRAAEALLAARARCLTSGTPRCLDGVDAPGSPVDAADRAAMASGVDAVRPPDVAPVLLRASGSTAVLAVGPDTVLEIREPDGWRLRDVIAPTAVRSQMPSEPSKSPSSSRARTAERNRAASAPSTIRWS